VDFNSIILYLSEWFGAIAVTLLSGLSARFRKRAVKFQYKRREGFITLGLYGIILLMAYLFYQGIIPSNSWGVISLKDIDKGFPLQLLVAALSLIPFAIALLVRRQPALSIGWNKVMSRSGLIVGAALGFLTFFLRGKFFTVMNGVGVNQGWILLATAAIVLAEETIFRGYIQLRLMDLFGEQQGWFSTTLLYTLWVLPRLMTDPSTLLVKLAITAIQGLLLGWIFKKNGHILSVAIYRIISDWTWLI